MQPFRQMATRYLQAWLGLWLLVVLVGTLAPCCEVVAETSLAVPDASLQTNGPHEHDSNQHHEPASHQHAGCEPVSVSPAADILLSKTLPDPEPIKSLLIGGMIGPVFGTAVDVYLQIPAIRTPVYPALYLTTLRLRI